MTAAPIIFPVISIPHVHDGDTLWVVRRWRVGDDGTGEIWKNDYAGGIPVRLTDGGEGLDTPELKTGQGARNALADLQSLVLIMSGDPMELVWWGRKSFDRLLGDIRIPGSVYGLTSGMRAKGWSSWKK